MDFEAPSLRRTMSTPQYYNAMDDYLEFQAPMYFPEQDFTTPIAPPQDYSAKMDRSHTFAYYDSSDLLATPQTTMLNNNCRSRKSLSTPHVYGYEDDETTGLLTPSSTSSSNNISMSRSASVSNTNTGYNNYMPFMTPSTPQQLQPAVKLDFSTATPKSVAMTHSVSDMTGGSSNGVNPFYSPPSYLNNSQTPKAAQSANRTPPSLTDTSLPTSPMSHPQQYFTQQQQQQHDQPTSQMMPPSPVMTAADQFDQQSKSRAQIAADMALKAVSANPEYQQMTPQLLSSIHQSPPRASPKRRPGPGRPPKSVDAKPHRCQLCSKSFRRLEHLKRHAKIHTEERPFQCDVPGCERRFSRSDNLRAHRRTHMKKGGRNMFIEGLDV